MLKDEEAIVRRECVDFLCVVVSVLQSAEVDRNIASLLIHVLRKLVVADSNNDFSVKFLFQILQIIVKRTVFLLETNYLNEGYH